LENGLAKIGWVAVDEWGACPLAWPLPGSAFVTPTDTNRRARDKAALFIMLLGNGWGSRAGREVVLMVVGCEA
jgi:hypothetical protein